MITFLKKFWDAFLHDEMKFRRWSRTAIMALSTGGLAFADQLAGVVEGGPRLIKTIKVIAVICAGISVAINLGDKNPPKEGTNVQIPQS